MKVILNDKIINISESTTLSNLLSHELQITPEKKGIAIALNNTIIPKNKWDTTILQNNDEIIVIIAAQGG